MNLPESTYQILYMKHSNLPYDEKWVKWSEEMISEGYSQKCDDLLTLCAERPPFNEFEMKDLVERILYKLSLDTNDKETVLRDYLMFLRSKVLEHEMDIMEVLREIVDIYNDLDMNDSLHEFFLLYYAKDDIDTEGVQFYISQDSARNINKTIYSYFENWKREDFILEVK